MHGRYYSYPRAATGCYGKLSSYATGLGILSIFAITAAETLAGLVAASTMVVAIPLLLRPHERPHHAPVQVQKVGLLLLAGHAL